MADDVQFEEEDAMITRVAYNSLNEPKGLSKIVIRLGLAKNESQANYVLIGVMVVALLATLYVISHYLV